MLNEAQIKAAVIDRLLERGKSNDGVLISELAVARHPRRVDLAWANGSLQAFEIKSDFDSLTRLDGQMLAYASSFDKVTLAVAPKFVHAVLNRYPSNVEVWEVYSGRGEVVHVTQRRRGVSQPIRCRATLAGFLRKAEIVKFLRLHGVRVKPTHPRTDLISLLDRMPVASLRPFVLSSIQDRFRGPHDAFIALRRGATEVRDLAGLQRCVTAQANLTAPSAGTITSRGSTLDYVCFSTPRQRALDVQRLSRQYGVDIETIPRAVLLRSSTRQTAQSSKTSSSELSPQS